MRRRPASPAVSLFPFLAVLLCAMGALILLLLVLTRQIRDDALRAASQKESPPAIASPAEDALPTVPTVVVTVTPPAPPPPIDPNVALRERLSLLTAERDGCSREFERLRLAVAQRQESLRSVEAGTAAAQFDLEAARRRLAAREAELRDREAERARLLDAIGQAEGTLAAVRQAVEAAEPKVSILPYDGRSGTARRPILIECSDEAIRFVPEGVELSSADLDGFLPDYNPLLAGAVALREYWRDTDGPAAPRPYVLLLVRDDGVAAYYAARAMLRSLGGETGYELVTGDMEFALPEADPAARDACREAVLDLLRQRATLLAEVSRRGGREPLFPTGRFEVDPLDHDPTRRLASPFERDGAAGEPSGPSPPERTLTEGPRPMASASPAGPAEPNRLRTSPGPSPAGSVARYLSEQTRAQQRERSLAEAERLLREAAGESFPSFDSPASERRRWGVSAPSANIALERPVAIEVRSDRIVVGLQEPIPVGEQGVTRETVAAVLEAVDREAHAWGRAPGQFYWRPRVLATVQPRGTRHADRLKRDLGGSGLRVSDRISLDPPAPAFVELSHVPQAP